MGYFTVEANGQPIAVLSASTRDDAEQLVDEQKVEFELLGACEPKAALFVRSSFDEELDRWHQGVRAAVADGSLDSKEEADENGSIVFLVPVSDPTDEAFDDEDL